MLDPKTKQRYSQPYMWAIIVLGTVAGVFTASRLDTSGLGLKFALISIVTLAFGSRVRVRIPRVRGEISVSDTFIFFVLFLFGGEAAILLSAADAFCSSLRITKRKMVIAFNAAGYVCSTFLTVAVLRYGFGDIQQLPVGDPSTYVSAVCAMALVQYVVNSGLVAVGVALRSGLPIWQMWRQNFLWTSITYFAGASAAGVITKCVESFGLYAFLATAPIVIVVYVTYCTYLKNVEASSKQADLARQHALEVQQHMEALRASEERFRSAFDNATIGMAVVSLQGRWLQVNRSLCDIIGYAEDELLEADVQRVTHRDDLVALDEQMARFSAGTVKSHQTEVRYCHKSGKEVWAHLGMSLVRDGEARPLHLIFQIQDITDRKRAEEQLLHDAFHDALTGCRTARCSWTTSSMAIQRSRRSGDRLFAVALPRPRPLQDHQRQLSATWSATSCSSASRTASKPACAPATRSRASAATSSPSCSKTSRTPSDAIDVARPRTGGRHAALQPRRPRSLHDRQHRHRALRRPATTGPKTSCATPTPRCTAPSWQGKNAPRRLRPGDARPRDGASADRDRPAPRHRRARSSASTTSPSSIWRRARSRASRRWCAGGTPSAGSSRPGDFIPRRRGDRPHRAARAVGAERGVPADAHVAAAGARRRRT